MFSRRTLALLSALLLGAGCQSPTDPEESLTVDDFLVVTWTPETVVAQDSTDGKAYRVVRADGTEEVRLYDWKASFVVTAQLNDRADDDEYLTFPVRLTTLNVKVQQASAGIITPPTGGDVERSDYVVTQSSGNAFAGINTSNNMTFELWYDLPSLRREAVISVTLSFADAEGITFSKVVEIRVAP